MATRFADGLTDRIGRIVPMTQQLTAVAITSRKGGRASVAIWNQEARPKLDPLDIPLTVDKRPVLRLLVKFNCCWDRGNDYLAVDESWLHVRGKKDDPLFRYEYKRSPDKKPAAHLHVHAHRDEFVYMLVAGTRGRPKERWRTDEVPRLSAFHFPLGGHRFRPCVEDVLEALIFEFDVDTKPDWRAVIDEGRESWRRTQLRAAVRDAPSDAAATLTEMDWTCTAPDNPPEDSVKRLRAF